ncbi:MAG: hypothetical protein CMI76_01875 [Candidatus Pelagibacter sp.]|nr:hypothetical protein [Candidatus Pelagibacter sp.]|tara:strand:- start:3445 stop:3924 length:480 start_codon:yes stop_codon:yes gene_type:complete
MHFKKSINQGLFYIQGLRSFKDTLPNNIKKILNKRGYIYSDIINNWNYLVGKNISSICYPKSFKASGKNNEATLTISVQRGNEIDVEYSKAEIIKKINVYFGYKILSKIKLETFEAKTVIKNNKSSISNASKNRYLKNINSINNENIRKSLIKLTKYLK